MFAIGLTSYHTWKMDAHTAHERWVQFDFIVFGPTIANKLFTKDVCAAVAVLDLKLIVLDQSADWKMDMQPLDFIILDLNRYCI